MEHNFNIDIAIKYGVDEAIMINHLFFWILHNEANEKNLHEGYYWTFNSVSAFEKIFPYWSRRQIDRVLKSLETKGLILTGNYNKSAYDRTKWYTLTEPILKELKTGVVKIVNDISPNREMENTKNVNDISPNGETNTIYNTYNKKQIKKQYIYIQNADLVKITQEQYNSLTTTYPKSMIDDLIMDLDNYIANGKGSKYKDHYRVLRTWARKKHKETPPDKAEKEIDYVNV